ncbi:hypothetical protein [Ralstonia sp. Ralssp135]|uniref:hypothetical protein n=1 Tax=Ralstonia sp. Ralssp135 TaxID=3243016 RepID=UPI0039AFAC3A
MLTRQVQGAFEAAYEKAAASSQPDDWMNAALLGKQFSNAVTTLLCSPATAWECANPKDARHPMAFVTTKRPTMEHYTEQGWTVTPLFLCPSPELVAVLTNIERVRAFEAVGQHQTTTDCAWTYDEHDFKYDSACGEAWCFIDGGPQDNNVRFCQGCGGRVVLAAPAKQQEVDR